MSVKPSRRELDYIVVLYELEAIPGTNKLVGPQIISKKLGVDPSTAVIMLKKLYRKGYVKYRRRRGYALTVKGLKVVEEVVWRHRILEVFYVEYLGLEVEEACCLARETDLHTPVQVIERLSKYIGKPKCCPHGKPIPYPR